MNVRGLLALVGLVACGEPDAASLEVVVADASLGGTAPAILGATETNVFWSAGGALGGAAIATLPAPGAQIGSGGSGPVAHAGDYVAFVTEGRVSRVDVTGTVARIAPGAPTVLGGNGQTPPMVAFVEAMTVSWGKDDSQKTATLSKITRVDHVLVTGEQIYVAAAATGGTRLLRIDQRTAMITSITTSIYQAELFPGGPAADATFTGRIVGGDDEGVYWLVEEQPSRRGVLVRETVAGDTTVLLEHVRDASGFFVGESLVWQEGETLLSAPRTGGAASIIAELPGSAGAYADGFVYVTHGNAIERLRVE